MMRSLSVCLALITGLISPTQAQTSISQPAPTMQASLLASSELSLPTSANGHDSESTSSSSLGPAEAVSTGLPHVANPSIRPFSRVGVAFEFGLLGIGAQVATPLHNRGNLRFAFDTFNYSYLFNTNGFDVNATLNLRSFRMAYDFLPFRGSFHISPGVMLYNGNKFGGTVTVSPQESVTINDTTYTSSASYLIRGNPSVIFPKAAPALTIGWGNIIPRPERSHLSFPFEIGGIYTGQPNINLNLTGTACDSRGTHCMSVATSPSIQADIAAQQNTYKNDYSWLRFYPIVQFGVGYKF